MESEEQLIRRIEDRIIQACSTRLKVYQSKTLQIWITSLPDTTYHLSCSQIVRAEINDSRLFECIMYLTHVGYEYIYAEVLALLNVFI